MLDKKRFFIDPDIGKAEAFPPEAFTSREFLNLAIKKIFKRFWLLAPLEVPQRKNSWAPFEILGTRFIAVRDEIGRVRIFPNACTHKWSKLVAESGCGSKLICRYHGRQFNLQGKFMYQPGFEELENFPRPCDNLREFAFEQRFNLAFVNFGAQKVNFSAIFGPISRSLYCLPVEKSRLVLVKKEEIYGNWAYHLDNYVDELHLRFVHGEPHGLVDETAIESYTTKLYKYASLRWVYAKHKEDGFLHPKFSRPLFALWWHMFPNLTINVWKGGLSLNSYEPNLEDPNKTTLIIRHYAWDEGEFLRIRKKWDEMRVDREDLDVVGGVQRVIQRTPAPRGRLTPKGEAACQWFQRLIYEHVFEK